MSYVKANKENITSVTEDAKLLNELISGIKEKLDSFKSKASSEADKWESNETYIQAYIRKLKESFNGSASRAYADSVYSSLVDRTEKFKKDETGKEVSDGYSYSWKESNLRQWAIGKIQAKKNEYKNAIPSVTLENEVKKSKEVYESLNKVCEAIRIFEENVPSLEDAINTIGTLPEGFSVESIDMMIDGQQVSVSTLVYTDGDGNKYTVSELVNSFYTYLGSTVSSDIAIAYAGGDNLEERLLQNGKANAENVNSMLTRGFFSVASDAGISGMYNDAIGADTYDAMEIHNKFVDAVKEDVDVDGLSKKLAGLTNASAIGSMALAGLAFGTYKDSVGSVLDDAVVSEKETQKSPLGGGSDGGSYTTHETEVYTDPDVEISEEIPEEIPEEVTRLELEPIVEEELPNPINNDLTDEQIDEMAREEFDSQFETEEDYAKYLSGKMSEFDELFELKDSGQLESKLASYGYNEEEISYLLENKDVCMNAYISGEQSLALTGIANRIASENHIDLFDTSYDELPDFGDLTDGDVNSYITNVNFDPGVGEAKNLYNTAKSNYEDAVSKANASIEIAKSNKAALDKLLQDLGDDQDSWTEEARKSYNSAVKAYNDSVSKVNEDYSILEERKNELSEAKDNYITVRHDYLQIIKEENALQPNDNVTPPLPSVGDEDNSDVFTVSDEDILNTLIFTDTSVVTKKEDKK